MYEPQPPDGGSVGGEVQGVPQQGLGRNHRSLPVFRGAAALNRRSTLGLPFSSAIPLACGRGLTLAEPVFYLGMLLIFHGQHEI